VAGFAFGLSKLVVLCLQDVFRLVAGGLAVFSKRTQFFKGHGWAAKKAGQNEGEKINGFVSAIDSHTSYL
jgi:hypothetical protein